MKFDAFISYSHALDGRLAPALQRGLHRFTKPWYRLRALRVFRDETTLAVTPALWPIIRRSLDESGCLILMASPEAARSEWVRGEIDYWINTTSPKPLLIVWTDGELSWPPGATNFDWNVTTALPRTLRNYFTKGPPLYLDLRWAREEEQLSLKHPRFLQAVARLASGITGRELQDLLGQEVREHKKTRRTVALTLCVLTVALIAAMAGLIFAVIKERRARESLYFASIPATNEALRQGDTVEALRLLTNAPPEYRGWEWSFLQRRVGFAPLRLRHSQVAILDTGPLRGLGLRDIADKMFEGAPLPDNSTSGGIVAAPHYGGRGGDTIVLQTAKDRIALAVYQAAAYGNFGQFWLSPDGTCLLMLTNAVREQTISGDDVVSPPSSVSTADDYDRAILHVLPVAATFDTSRLGDRTKPSNHPPIAETPLDEVAELFKELDSALSTETPKPTETPKSTETTAPTKDTPEPTDATEAAETAETAETAEAAEESEDEQKKIQPSSISFEDYHGRLVTIGAGGAQFFAGLPDVTRVGRVRLELQDRSTTEQLFVKAKKDIVTNESLLNTVALLLTTDEREAAQKWWALNPNRIVLACDWSDPALSVLTVNSDTARAEITSLRNPDQTRGFDLPDTKDRWQTILENGADAYNAGAAFSRDRRKILICPFEKDQTAILDRTTLKPLSILKSDLMSANRHEKSCASDWGFSPFGNLAYLVLHENMSDSYDAAICRTDTGDEVVWNPGGRVSAVNWDSTEQLFAIHDSLTDFVTTRKGITGSVVGTAKMPRKLGAELIQEPVQSNDRVLIGRTLFRREDLRAILTLPQDLALGADWSWALFLVPAQAPTADDWPKIQLVDRISDPLAAPITVADKVQALQMTFLNQERPTGLRAWLGYDSESVRLSKETQNTVLGSFEYRVARLLAKLQWPSKHEEFLTSEVNGIRQRSAGLLDEAKALLAERPSSADARFGVAACSAMKGGDAVDASKRLVEDVHSEQSADPVVNPRWNQLAGILALEGHPAKVNLYQHWRDRVEALTAVKTDDGRVPNLLQQFKPGDAPFFDGHQVFKGLAAALEWQMGNKDCAAGWLAAIELYHESFPSWISESVVAGRLPDDPPFWFSCFPEKTRQALASALLHVPSKTERGRAILTMAQAYITAHQPTVAKVALRLCLYSPLPFVEKLDAFKMLSAASPWDAKPDAEDLKKTIEQNGDGDLPLEMRVTFFGRLAGGSGEEDGKVYAEKALSAFDGKTDASQGADALMGLVCARSRMGDQVGARHAFAELMRQEPALAEGDGLERRAWTFEELRLLRRYLGEWLNHTPPPSSLSAANLILRKARSSLLLGDDDAAVIAFRKALDAGATPDDAFWTNILPAALRSGDGTVRLAVVERALALRSTDPLAHACAALARMTAGKTTAALKALQVASRMDERFRSVGQWQTWMSKNDISRNEFKLAIKSLLDARPIEMITDSHTLLNRATDLLKKAGEKPSDRITATDQALPFLEKALQLSPDWEYVKLGETKIFRARAEAFATLGRLPEALAAYRHLLNGNHQEPADVFEAVNVAIRLGDKGAAQSYLDASQRRFRRSSAFARMEGWILLKLGNYRSAVIAFQRSLILEGGLAGDDLLVGLVTSRWLAGDKKGALSEPGLTSGFKVKWLNNENIKGLDHAKPELDQLSTALAEMKF